ncbi:MAG: type II toxin-antitoxin system RelE/ParE family toxin [Candidatus Omnitrophica bacterium]|nr:type II toxin-antitoxin system RelE/ParE family toxin [Candidatus Omnitrophota bacterium]MCB9768311.1 type II toxin-antitoxin system RelE/ParE family toxin [Candidatus Omnitrophota bacterium]
MKVVFTRLARLELEEAVAYYDMEVEGLGSRFQTEVKRGLNRIKEHPSAWAVERGEIRKYLLHKFPYKILYSVESDAIIIIAIAHLHRRPDYWIDRK